MNEPRPILITGGTGQVGFELRTALARLGPVVAPMRSELDLANPDSIRDVVRAQRPAVIVNAGAYTAVERADGDAELAAQLNTVAPGVLAEEAARLDSLLVHYSTDYVFDGTAARPYRESDAPAPLNAYGRTKLAGERAIIGVAGRHLILRTSWVYGARGSNFFRTMLRLAREPRDIPVVDDQVGAPTWSRSLAQATVAIIERLSEARDAEGGLYHLGSAGSASWNAFAQAILEEARAVDQVAGSISSDARIVRITTAEFASRVRRPAYSVLDSSMVRARFGVGISDWRSDLRIVVGELARITAS